MSALSEAVERFVQVVDGRHNLDDLRAGTAALHPLIPTAARDELDAALRALLPCIHSAKFVALGSTVITCGAIIESGGDPGICGSAILERLPDFLRDLAGFHAAVTARADPDEEIDRDKLIHRHFDDIFQTERSLAYAYMASQSLSLGAIAHLAKSKGLRALARARPELLELSFAADGAAGNGTFLTDMLRVLDDERLVVLHPGERRGFEVRISGVGDNFQLHTLLAGELIGDPAEGWLTGQKPPPEIVAAALDAEWTDRLQVTGAFNLWNWKGLQPDGTLPTGQRSSSKLWIWNEGKPGDIAMFEGVRVVLLGPPPYSRGWNSGRRFPAMPAEFTVERVLATDVVSAWLVRIAAAPRENRS